MQAATAAFPMFSFQVATASVRLEWCAFAGAAIAATAVAVIAAVSSARFVMCVITPR